MNESVPEHLYRITYPDMFDFGETGYLRPHREEKWLGSLLFRGRVPMVTEQDWEFVARYFAINADVFLRLTIESNGVESMAMGEHAYLSGLEFFGKVPRSAVVRVELCG